MSAPSSLVWSTATYATSDLTGSAYTVGDALYLETDTLKLTNKAANGIADIGAAGVIGTVLEAPDLDTAGDRMVLRVTASGAAFQTQLFALLAATEL